MVFLRHKDYSFWWLNQLMLFNHSETMPIGYEQLMNPNATHPYAIKLQRDWNSGRFGSPAEWVVKHVSREIVSPEQYKFIPKDGLFLSHSDKDMRPVELDYRLRSWDDNDEITLVVGTTLLNRKDSSQSQVIKRNWIVTDSKNSSDVELVRLATQAVTEEWDYFRYGALSNYRIVSHTYGVAKPTEYKTIKMQ